MESQVIIRIDSQLKQRAVSMAKAEGKNVSLVIRELLENYVKDRDMSLHIDDLWKRIGRNLEKAGRTEKDVRKAIKDARNNF